MGSGQSRGGRQKVQAVAAFSELKVKRREKPSRPRAQRRPIKQVPADQPSAPVTFVNTSRLRLDVFATAGGDDEEERYGEVPAGGEVTLDLPSGGGRCQVRDQEDQLFFQTTLNCPKTCLVPATAADSIRLGVASLTIHNTSSSTATVREVSLADGRTANKVVLVQAQQTRTIDTHRPQTYRLYSEHGGGKFEIMASAHPQVYQVERSFASVKSVSPPPVEYLEAALAGFLVLAPENLMNRSKHKQFWDALDLDLQEMRRLLPSSAIRLMRRIALYINLDNPGKALTGMCFHRGVHWLAANGESLEKYGAIEVRSTEDFLRRRRAGNPSCLLHEYAHGFHFFSYRTNHGLIEHTFEETLAKGQYSSLSLPRPHYCIQDSAEYFAECSCAFFCSGRFRAPRYPHDAFQLQAFDPLGFQMCEKVYNVSGAERVSQFFHETRTAQQ